MPNIVDKVKEVIAPKHQLDSTGHHHAAGHDTRADPIYGGTQPIGGNSNITGLATNTGGPHASNLLNKLDPNVNSNASEYTAANPYGSTAGPASSTYGPHSTNIANKLDPTVHGTHSAGHTVGPHSSDFANKIDPRVDSNADGSRTLGNTSSYAATGPGVVGGTYGDSTGTYASHLPPINDPTTGPAPHTYGPHKTDLLNKLDPKVDSDGDGKYGNKIIGAKSEAQVLGGTYGSTGTTHGPHSTNLANKLDPTVHTGVGHGLAEPGYGSSHNPQSHLPALSGPDTGPAPHTYGPHKLDILNKLDPRVDSDLDGSKTIGNNKFVAVDEPVVGTAGTGIHHDGYHAGHHPGHHETHHAHHDPGVAAGHSTTTPHSSSLLNKLDPRVNDSATPATTNTGVALLNTSGAVDPNPPRV